MPVAGNGGACCECNQLSGCDCEKFIPSGLQCQTKAEFASLCGYSEYASPSVPPKKYLSQAISGSLLVCNYPSDDCSGSPTGQNNGEWSGSYNINPETCEGESSAYLQNFNHHCTGIDSLAGDPSLQGGGIPITPDVAIPITETTKTRTVFSTLGCVPLVGGGSQRANKIDGGTGESVFAELDVEDTEDNAENRAAAAITDWTGCGSCDILCSAFRSVRGAGEFTFGFRKLQTKITWNAAIGNHSYKATARFYRRVLGTSGPFLFFALDERTLTFSEVSVTAVETDWIDVPSESGWETISSGQTVEILP